TAPRVIRHFVQSRRISILKQPGTSDCDTAWMGRVVFCSVVRAAVHRQQNHGIRMSTVFPKSDCLSESDCLAEIVSRYGPSHAVRFPARLERPVANLHGLRRQTRTIKRVIDLVGAGTLLL